MPAQLTSAEYPPKPDEGDPSSRAAGWGGLVYVSGHEAYDDVTSVDGGAEGSALLMIQRPSIGKTEWIFLHGESMYLRIRGLDKVAITDIPGMRIRSRRYYEWDAAPTPSNRRRLNSNLIKLYRKSKILHTPFLTGQAWQGFPPGQQSASRDEAERVLAAMNLSLQVLPTDDPNGQRGYVIEQHPAGGVPVNPGSIVWVKLDGTVIQAPSFVGDTPPTATELPPWQNGQTDITTEVTSEYVNQGNYTSCGGPDGIDVFWKLPDLPDDKSIRVQRLGSYERVELTVLEAPKGQPENATPLSNCNECCQFGVRPQIRFEAQAAKDYFVVIEVLNPDDTWIELEVEWEGSSAGSTGSAAQQTSQQ
ncbi:MAG: hypothetical protein ACE5GE_11435 [Phycisphaerae bacterium]